MSRFGLRSNSDGLKLSEEKANSKKLCKSAKVALKRVYQKKKKNLTLHNESDSKEASQKNVEEAEEENAPISLVCSLPLDRLKGIIEKLNSAATANSRNEDETKKEQYFEKDHDDGQVQVDGEEEKKREGEKEEDSVKYQKLPTQSIKILCLYCDKKFTSHKMQSKHVEKFHTQHSDRRCSGRNSQTHRDSKKQRAAAASANFPGCTFCKKTKTQQISVHAKDLSGLFVHLTECHSEKYFGCKPCVMRFQNISKLSKHMQTVHKNLSFAYDDNSKSKDDDTDSLSDKPVGAEKGKQSKLRPQKSQKTPQNTASNAAASQSAAANGPNPVIGAEEPILSRLGLTQNRLPNNRKGVRLRRETVLPDALLKNDQTTASASATKIRNKAAKSTVFSSDADVVFRMPMRTEVMSCIYDDDFYREVISNVRTNLMFHLDGKIQGDMPNVPADPPLTLVKARHSQSGSRAASTESPSAAAADEIHAATSLTASTAFPTLLTAEQYGAEATTSKIRRPHTKNSWKWKWDSVKKFKLINEGGKIIKKMKQPMLGLRDLSKLDMWTQLTMRQKNELQQQQRHCLALKACNETSREERQRLNEQLNFILDLRLLPHIILEQNEQAIIKLENEEFGIASQCRNAEEDCADSILGRSFADESFLSLLQLLPHNESHMLQQRLVLSGEWARPRCYLCMCCGAKFEKLKSLEEHKMFRHSHIYSTHYEVVGRELLAGNLLRHLFIPKRALSFYGHESNSVMRATRRFAWGKTESMNLAEDESSDSVQSSILNNCTTHTYCIKNSISTSTTTTTTDECDTDTKTTLLDINTVSPSHSMQSSSSSFNAPMAAKMQVKSKELTSNAPHCTKCNRKCNGIMDLYRHMLDCSGDYVWSLAKKRKYRYYCGSKKRRPCNKHNFSEVRKIKQKCSKAPNPPSAHDMDEGASNFSKTKTPPRPRPSDAESIKKMLENLPPKRVCKKIFPTDTKTRKSKKSKLIAKHKLYNTQVLRKTRARQISQAAKLLSNTKNQFPKKAPSKQSLKMLRHRNKNLEPMKNNSSRSAAEDKSLSVKSAEVDIKSTNDVVENVKHEDANKSDGKETNSSKDDDDTPSGSRNDNLPISAPASAVETATRSTVKNKGEETPSPSKEQDANVAAKSMDVAPSNKPESVTEVEVTPSTPANSDSKRTPLNIDNPNNKKRSKKINDCIAMLTGKLEEKLKTEQKVDAKTDTLTEADKTPNSSEKKTPKRKTISRRIIKLDDMNSEVPAEKPQAVAIVPEPPPPQPPLVTQITPLPTVMKVTATATATATAPQVPCMPLPPGPMSLNMLPKLPLFIPVDNFRPAVPPAPVVPVPLQTISAITPIPTIQPLAIQTVPLKALSVSPCAVPTPLLQPPPPPLLAPLPLPPPPAPPPMTMAQFNLEPLNLSSSKPLHQQNMSQDLSCATAHRMGGIPMRRQTICGFEARSFLAIEESEPLDLSRKSRMDPPILVSPAHLAEVVPAATLVQHSPSLTKTNEPVAIQPLVMTLPQDVLLNKQFYSNLELLKIPQVRNPVYVPTPEVANFTPKCTPKKRNNSKALPELVNKPAPMVSPVKTFVKEPAKKENSAKNKPIQKMDEEVINHIDDAINSVINAVKASLPDSDDNDTNSVVENLLPKAPLLSAPPVIESTITVIEEAKSECATVTVVPLKHLTPQKRCMRSKTLDCRPAALASLHKQETQSISVKNIGRSMSPPVQSVSVCQESVPDKPSIDDRPIIPNIVAPSTAVTVEPQVESVAQVEATPIRVDRDEPVEEEPISTINTSKSPTEAQIEEPSKLNEIESPVDKIAEQEPVSHETNINSISEENISNINNTTSSGFHSSGPEKLVSAQKKTRRRRKNELAAIVADQLLESFKIDKARRDNLKKLENLAYEKSEDLLLTGMLLMSSTKRNASSFQQHTQTASSEKAHDKSAAENTKAQKQDQKKGGAKNKSKSVDNLQQEVADVLQVEKDKETRNKKIKEVKEVKEVKGKEESEKVKEREKDERGRNKKKKDDSNEKDKTKEKEKEKEQLDEEKGEAKNEKEKEIVTKKGSKRRQYRRRAKTIDNENISKLKSSLESFSIGIEKQLSEIEAKNAMIFNVSESKTRNTATAASTKSTVILRPSILSATLEQPNAASKGAASDNKTVPFSRDPRLNKNIHKDGREDEVTEVGEVLKEVSPDEKNLEICDFEEDNYLTEIAKNVNEKIMSAENEDFAFANDGFEMANELQDDSNSKFYSRPPTSMSVRSAPNFNDDRSNFGSICDENTNTEVMDMDLDDEMSVYTSYSQDVGRGRGRRRRRRRSILLRRKPKKRRISRDLSAERFDCELCKKTFFTATSLAKHNMTLLHVSKVSAQEYLLSKSLQSADDLKRQTTTLRASAVRSANEAMSLGALAVQHMATPRASGEVHQVNHVESRTTEVTKEKQSSFNSASRLTLNPDERLFFECCNILKGAETPRIMSEDCNNGAAYTYAYQDKTSTPCILKPPRSDVCSPRKPTAPPSDAICYKPIPPQPTQQQNVFRDPQAFNKIVNTNERHLLSPNYSAVSQFSAVTNTTSRFKTKAAMKGYENVHMDLTVQQLELEAKSRKVCKLTELAEIALGNEKPSSPEFTPGSDHRDDSTPKNSNAREFVTKEVDTPLKDNNVHLNCDRPKNNETQSSTSSKTIMHSSIIKAAVEEHTKAPSSKIIIPDRPFKNIGLEEKETITFQKPKTTVNLLTDDNSVSTVSYSDRDDFDFGSLSCDDDSSVKTTNERHIKNNSSESSSSRATAKTFENKSLIMGRIFKNASTKPKSCVKVKSVGVQKDQAPKADLNQLFDELRNDSDGRVKGAEARKDFHSLLNNEGTKERGSTVAQELPSTRKSKEVRKKSIAPKKSHKDISKLQSELGMSPEEIEKLIADGQRKSKRRCATNKPKKLVEMWSSDEYEEFLSTKDIIALIEEKEKQEKRRKRKNSTNLPGTSEVKEKTVEPAAESRRRNASSVSGSERKAKAMLTTAPKETEEPVRKERSAPKSTVTCEKSAAALNSREFKEREKHTRRTSAAEGAAKPTASTSKVNHNSTSSRQKNKRNNTAKSKPGSATHTVTSDNDTVRTSAKVGEKETADSMRDKHNLQTDDDCFLSDLKRNNHRTRYAKESKHGESKKDVHNFKAYDKEPGTTEVSKKRNINNNNNNNNTSNTNNNNNRGYKSKRKTQQNQSPARRKRSASEKLYYWSSSSDEDFGRINTSHAEEFENGEQYQKHGWIVGDSHKKLVTLLAIAKGNKKVDNCGVKKNVCKKKS